MTIEERRASVAYVYMMLQRSPDMHAGPVTSVWPVGIDPNGTWSDEEMDRIEAALDGWGV
jgi:hypothetical protein